MKLLTNLVSVYLVMISTLAYGDVNQQTQKLSSTNVLIQPRLPKEHLDTVMSLIATNLLPLLESNIELDCLHVVRLISDDMKDDRKRSVLSDYGLTKKRIHDFCEDSLRPFFWGKDYALDEIEDMRKKLESDRGCFIITLYSLASGERNPKVTSYEGVLKSFQPSWQIRCAILSSHFKAVMHSEVAEILSERLKEYDKEGLYLTGISNALKMVELDEKKVLDRVPPNKGKLK